jgi:hypothetical protein
VPRWTQAEYETLRAAVASGVLSVSYAGPPQRTVQYQSLAEMRKLLADMEREVNGSATPRSRLATFRKGF